MRRTPEPSTRRYGSIGIARRGESIELAAPAGARVSVDDLLPAPLQ